MDDINVLLKEYLDLKEQKDNIERDMNFVKGKIETFMQQQGVDIYDSDLASVKQVIRNNTKIDRKKVELLLGEGFKEVVTKSQSSFITITKK